MLRKLAVIPIAILLAISLVACTPAGGTESDLAAAQEIVDAVIESMENVTSYQFETDMVMDMTGDVINGLALNYYTWNSRPAAEFDEKGWFEVIQKTLRMDEIISKHSRVMDQHDPQKKVALIVD